MIRMAMVFSFSILSIVAFAADQTINALEDKNTLMGVIEFPLDVSQTEAVEIAKFLKKELKFDHLAVRQISSRRYGIEIQTKYDGGERAMNSILEKSKSLVTSKFGKNTIASWGVSGTVYFIQ